MDKETLSNYGWIVICVLVIAVMIALAGPFGNFIAGAIKSTTAGFFSVNQNAMNAGGITIPGQDFDDTPSDDVTKTGYKFGDGAKQGDYMLIYIKCENYEEYMEGLLDYAARTELMGMSWEEATDFMREMYKQQGYADEEIEQMILESETNVKGVMGQQEMFEEFMRDVEGDGWSIRVTDVTKTTYGPMPTEYDGVPVVSSAAAFWGCENLTVAPEIPATLIDTNMMFADCKNLTSVKFASNCQITALGNSMFGACEKLTSIEIPISVKTIEPSVFARCTGLTDVYYAGTPEQWAQINIGNSNTYLTSATIHYNYTGE